MGVATELSAASVRSPETTYPATFKGSDGMDTVRYLSTPPPWSCRMTIRLLAASYCMPGDSLLEMFKPCPTFKRAWVPASRSCTTRPEELSKSGQYHKWRPFGCPAVKAP